MSTLKTFITTYQQFREQTWNANHFKDDNAKKTAEKLGEKLDAMADLFLKNEQAFAKANQTIPSEVPR